MKLHTIVIFCVVTARSAFMYEWAWTRFWSNDPSGPGPWALVWRHLTQSLAQLTTYYQHVVETESVILIHVWSKTEDTVKRVYYLYMY